MARIRSVKPEFWTSEQVVECSPIARLLFLGMWNFCDDQGVHTASAKTLKMEVFPGDDFTVAQITGYVQELINAGLLIEYEVDGNRYWFVTGWKHQKIDKPNKKHPLPPNTPQPFAEDSPNGSRTLDEHLPEEGKGREGIGKENTWATLDGLPVPGDAGNPPIPIPKKIPDCPHQSIIDLYHETLPLCPRVLRWTPDRERHLRSRWREIAVEKGWQNEADGMAWWRKFFGFVSESKFLTGRINGRDGKPPFVADLEWITKPSNFTKIIEGKYG